MAYSSGQIATILLKADKTMYKLGDVAYEDMFYELDEAYDYERDIIFIYKKAVEYGDDYFVGTLKLDQIVERLAAKLNIYDYGILSPIYVDVYTQIDQGLNIIYVLKTTALNLGTGLTGSTDFSQSQVDIDLDYVYLNSVYVVDGRTLTINGVTYDLSANRTWNVGTVTGTGTTNYVSKWGSSSSLANSLLYDNGTSVMINTTTPNTSFVAQLINASVTNSNIEIRSAGQQSALHLSLGTTDTDIRPRVELFNSGNFGIVMFKPGVVNSNYLMYYDAESVSNRSLSFQTEGQNRLILNQTGSIRAPRYGGGLVTGSPTYRIATDASGNFIEVTDAGGSVTSVDMTVPTGLTISGNPIVTSGTLALGLAAGYFIPTTSSQANWDAAYNDKINSANVTGTTTKTLTLIQQDGGTITASWSDYDTAPVTSVFGRTGAVVAAEGDYNLNQLGDVIISSPTNGQVLKYNGAEWVNNTDTDTGLTSVGLTMPSAFNVANSPLTSNGTIAVTGAGTSAQYVRGDGQLANFPTSGGGGSSVNYYLNGSVNQGTFGGDVYYEMSKTPIIGAGTNFTRTSAQGNGYIASFITDAGDPGLLNIPGGNWNLEFYFNASSGGGNPLFYGEIYKVSSSNVFTLVASGSTNPEGITQGTVVDQYFTSIPVPQTTLVATDRIAIRIYVLPDGRNITLHTENSNLCEVLTTFSTGLNALNGLTAQVQYFATGTTGMDFNISSVSDTHTFNIPDASATARGLITTGTQTIAGAKTFSISPIVPSLYLTNMTAGSGALYYGLAANRLTLANYNVGGSIVFEVNGGQYAMEIKSDLGIRFDGYTTNGFLKTSGSNGTLIVDTTSYVPTTRQLTINGTAYDLSAVRSWSVGTVTSVAALTLGTTGTDLSSTVATGTTTPVITLNVPTASATNRGVLSSADWTSFNNKQNALTNPVTGTGTAGQVAFFSGTSAITGENNLFWNALYNRLGVNTNNPYLPVDIVADELGYNLSLRGEPSNAVAHIRFYSNDGITPYSHIKSTDTEFLLGSIATNDVIFVSSGVEGIRITNTQQVKLSNIPQAVTDTNRFLVSDLGYIKYRTGAEILSDIGAQGLLTLTTTGSSGASTLISNTLNIPTYTLSGLGGVPTTRTLTINGTAYDLSADRTWNVGTVTSATATTGGQVAFFNGATVITSVSGLYFDGINRLGIGTISPLYNLDVTGTARMTGNLTAASLIKSGGTSSQYLMADGSTSTLTNPVTGTGTTNYLPKWTSGSALGNSLVYDNGTSVGINNTSPQSFDSGGIKALDGKGNTGFAFIAQGASTQFRLAADDSVGGVLNVIGAYPLVFFTNATERMRLTSTGLGIGTTSPGYKLDVVGIIATSGTGLNASVRITNTTATTGVDWNLYSLNNGNFGLYNNTAGAYAYQITPSGNLGLGVVPSAWGSAYRAFQIGNSGFMSNDSNLWMYANGYFDGTNNRYFQTGLASRYYQYAGTHYWENAPSGTAGNAITFTQAMTLNASGSLGLGTTGPVLRLDVQGNSADTTTVGGVTVEQVTLFRPSNGVGGIRTGFNTTTGDGYFWSAQSGASLNFGTRIAPNNNVGMTLDASGRLGLGTTSPDESLVISKSTFPTLKLTETTASNSIILQHHSSTNEARLTVTGAYPLVFKTSDAERLRITSGGDIGIGTTSPAYLLDLVKNQNASTISSISNNTSNTAAYSALRIASSTNVWLYNFSNGYTTSGKFAAGTFLLDVGTVNGININTSDAAPIILSTTNTERLRITSGGNVGINTSSPASKLDVNGDITGRGAFNGYASSTHNLLIDWSASSQFTTLTNTELFFGTNAERRMTITNGGNVLIGTATNGASKLRVVGLPTSATGLSAGDIWNDGGTLKIV